MPHSWSQSFSESKQEGEQTLTRGCGGGEQERQVQGKTDAVGHMVGTDSWGETGTGGGGKGWVAMMAHGLGQGPGTDMGKKGQKADQKGVGNKWRGQGHTGRARGGR